MKIIFYFFQYIFIKLLFSLLKILPLKLAKKISSSTVKLIGKFSSAHKTAKGNCKLVFPDLNEAKVEGIVNKSWENIGETICELLKFKEVYNKNIIVLKNLENINYLINNRKQAIFIGIHQSNWETFVPILDRLNFNITGIYRHINNYFLDRLLLNIRNNTLISKKNFYTPKGKKGAKDIINSVKNNYSLLILIDQKDSAGEDVYLFKKQVKTQIGFLKVARKFNLPIVPIKNTRLNNGKIELSFHKPILHNNDDLDDLKMMEIIHRIVEGWIVSNPNQWFWQHKRFN